MRTPCVSIGFPVHNGGSDVARALDSILQQDFEDFEVIISDNASTDSTHDICEAYAQRDNRVRYFRNESNIGVIPNHNRVFELSRGRYFKWTAHDVACLPGMLSRCVAEMERAGSGIALVYPRCELMNWEGVADRPIPASIASAHPRPYRRLEWVMRHVLMVTQLYGLMPREVLRKTGLLGAYPSSDHVLLGELAMLGEIREVPEVLLRRWLDQRRGTASAIKSQRMWSSWLDPRNAGRHMVLPVRERVALKSFQAALRLPLKPADKFTCAMVAPLLGYWRILLRVSGPARHAFRRFSMPV